MKTVNHPNFGPIIRRITPKFEVFRLFNRENGSFSPFVDFPGGTNL